jgi:hypothetical protein
MLVLHEDQMACGMPAVDTTKSFFKFMFVKAAEFSAAFLYITYYA